VYCTIIKVKFIYVPTFFNGVTICLMAYSGRYKPTDVNIKSGLARNEAGSVLGKGDSLPDSI
jgi:hypothetical protein